MSVIRTTDGHPALGSTVVYPAGGHSSVVLGSRLHDPRSSLQPSRAASIDVPAGATVVRTVPTSCSMGSPLAGAVLDASAMGGSILAPSTTLGPNPVEISSLSAPLTVVPADPVFMPSAALDSSWKAPANPPARLTDGFPDPISVEAQRLQYDRSLDEQLKHLSSILAQRHQATLEFLRSKSDQQKKQSYAMIDQQLMQDQLDLEAKCSDQMRLLAQAATQRKVELDRQANALTLDYTARKLQEDLQVQDYELHRKYFEARAGKPGAQSMLPQPQGLLGALPPAALPGGFASGFGSSFSSGPPCGLPPPPPAEVPHGYPHGFGGAPPGMPPPYGAQHGMYGADSFHGGGYPPIPPAGVHGPGMHSPAMYNHGGMRGKLEVIIHAAHRLKNMDTGILGDVSDPYVLATVGKQKQKTPTINNDLNPQWKKHNHFTFNIGEREDLLHIEVFNHNFMRDASLGTTSVDLHTLPPGQWHRMRERLVNGADAEIDFDVMFTPAMGGAGPCNGGPRQPRSSSHGGGRHGSSEIGSPGHPRRGPPDQYGSSQRGHTSPPPRHSSSSHAAPPSQAGQHEYIRAKSSGSRGGGPSSTLYLVIWAGHNLVNKDTGIMGDVSDPYVVAKVGKQEHKTPHISNELNPTWKEKNQFAFHVDEEDHVLMLEAKNANYVRDDSLGTTRVDIRSLPPGHWQRLRQPLDGVKSGELEFDVRYEPVMPLGQMPLGHMPPGPMPPTSMPPGSMPPGRVPSYTDVNMQSDQSHVGSH